MVSHRLHAMLIAAVVAIFISAGSVLLQPPSTNVVAPISFNAFAGVMLLFAIWRHVPNSECSKSDTLRVLKQRTASFESIAESLAVEAKILSVEVSEVATSLQSRDRYEQALFVAMERLFSQFSLLSDVSTSAEICLTQLDNATINRATMSSGRHRPFSNSFAQLTDATRGDFCAPFRLEHGAMGNEIETTLRKQFHAIVVLVQSIGRTLYDMQQAHSTVVNSSQHLARILRERAETTERFSLSVERIAAIFREVDAVLDLALRNSPITRATLTSGNRIESGHSNSAKHCTLKTVASGALDQRQLVQIR